MRSRCSFPSGVEDHDLVDSGLMNSAGTSTPTLFHGFFRAALRIFIRQISKLARPTPRFLVITSTVFPEVHVAAFAVGGGARPSRSAKAH